MSGYDRGKHTNKMSGLGVTFQAYENHFLVSEALDKYAVSNKELAYEDSG